MGNRLRGRFFLVAALLIPLNAYWILQSEVIRYAGHPTTTSLFYNVIVWLCLLVGVNAILRRISPKIAFNRAELLMFYAVLNLTSGICGHDAIEVLLPILSYPTHFANAANNWAADLIPLLPRHLSVTDDAPLTDFYSGHSTLYQSDHWHAWLIPVLSWTLFLGTLLAFMLCLNVIIRKRWTRDEKLAFPLILLPMALTEDGAPILRNRLLWLGFAIASAFQLWNGIASLNPSVPMIPLKANDYGSMFTSRPWNAIGGVPVGLYPFGIALGMLLPLDLLFSSWFFFWFWKAQLVISAATGWDREPNFPYVNAQSLGAYIGIALGALWGGRRHLGYVVRVAFGEERDDDPESPIPLRFAAFGALFCLILLIAFCRFAGMSYLVIALALGIYLAIVLAVTRMRAELGPPVHDLHYAGPDTMLPQVAGPTAFSQGDLVGLSFFWGFNRAYRCHPMPGQLESMKMSEGGRIHPRSLFFTLLAAGFVGPLAAFWLLLQLGYERGAAGNIGPPNVLQIFGGEAWNRWNNWTHVPQPANLNMGAAVLIGMGFTFLLNVLRSRLIGFPFHPVGYAITSSWGMSLLWLPMFIAWLMKFLLLRYGGLTTYRKVLPFFYGVILGECLWGGFWNLTAMILDVPGYGFWP